MTDKRLWSLAGAGIVLGALGVGGMVLGSQTGGAKPARPAAHAARPTPAPLSYSGVDGKTAIDLLAQRAVIGLSGTGSTAHVTAINGYRADESNRQYWALYLNGVVSETRANQLVTKTGDQLEWKLAAY